MSSLSVTGTPPDPTSSASLVPFCIPEVEHHLLVQGETKWIHGRERRTIVRALTTTGTVVKMACPALFNRFYHEKFYR